MNANITNILIVVLYGATLGLFINYLNKRMKNRRNFITSKSSDEFKNIKNKSQLVDIRKKAEYEKSKMLGARNIPLSEINRVETKLFKDKTVYLYGDKKSQVKKAAYKLIKQEYTSIVIMKDSFKDYTGRVSKK